MSSRKIPNKASLKRCAMFDSGWTACQSPAVALRRRRECCLRCRGVSRASAGAPRLGGRRCPASTNLRCHRQLVEVVSRVVAEEVIKLVLPAAWPLRRGWRNHAWRARAAA
eukprot:4062874-Pleurochrysis_carterae.AAC.1